VAGHARASNELEAAYNSYKIVHREEPMKRALLLIGMLLLFNAVAVGETYTGSKALTQ